ncbi:MAG TPA: basic secretory protein-like protein [Verrucomicrobiae bacterium]|nr:basic secretory protein-like protein [Verrucomicrobiae bacterium]
MPTASTNRAGFALDGQRETFFRSRRGPDEKDHFTVYFSRPVVFRHVEIQTGSEDGENRLAEGALEISADGKEFKPVASFQEGTARADLNNTIVKALRLRPAKKDRTRLEVREIVLDPPPRVSSITQGLCITVDTSTTPELEAWGKQSLALCQEWYPRLVALLPSDGFEPYLSTRLIFSNEMRGVAATSGCDIRIAGKYVSGHTNDFGMVIHELTHVVQAYNETKPGYERPGWLVEGIADNIRLFHYEPEARRPRINPDKASYKDAYKTTAIFLDWAQTKYDKGLVVKLNAALRQGIYRDALFQQYTGKTVDELWQEFADGLRKQG